jgi:hypothetical protein
MSSVPDSTQKVIVEGQLLVSTNLNTNVQEKGQIAFVDKTNLSRVLAGMRIFGTPQSRLIVDAYNSANGMAFRTNVDQGTTTEGGKGYAYSMELNSFGNRSGQVFEVVEQNIFQNPNTEKGTSYFNVTRAGTRGITASTPSTRYISKFEESSVKTGEEVYISCGTGQGRGILGFNNSGANSFLAYGASSNAEPVKSVIWSGTGLVALPQSLYVGDKIEAGSKVVVFNRANTNFLQLPSSTLTFTTTGMSFLAAVKFTGTPGDNERVFEFATATNGSNTFYISRSGTSSTLRCAASNATTQVGIIDGVGSIVQDAWTVIAATYSFTTSTIILYQGGVSIGSVICSQPLTDRTSSTSQSFLGRSTVAADSYTSYSIGCFYVYNKILTPAQISAVTSLNYNLLPLTYSPVSSFIGPRLNYMNGQAVSEWEGSFQTTAARQPITEVVGLLYSSSGLNVETISATNYLNLPAVPPAQLLPITLDATNNRVGINNTTPHVALAVTGHASVTETMDAGNLASRGMLLVVGDTTLSANLEVKGFTGIEGDLSVLGDTTLYNTNVIGKVTAGTVEALDTTTGTLHLGSIPNSSKSNVLMYDTTTKEVSYGASASPDLLPITLDKVNNRVGINKTVPTTALDVGGAVTASGAVISGGVTSGTLSLTGIPNTTKTNTLYYDTTTKEVSYGAGGSSTPVYTEGFLAADINKGSDGQRVIFTVPLTPGVYNFQASIVNQVETLRSTFYIRYGATGTIMNSVTYGTNSSLITAYVATLTQLIRLTVATDILVCCNSQGTNSDLIYANTPIAYRTTAKTGWFCVKLA